MFPSAAQAARLRLTKINRRCARVCSPAHTASVFCVVDPIHDAEYVRVSSMPELRSPVLIVAFEGWNDAGDAASTTAHHLIDRLNGEVFADIDPEDFFDFTAMRPTVEIVDGTERQLHWPDSSFYACRLADAPFDVIIMLGVCLLYTSDAADE